MKKSESEISANLLRCIATLFVFLLHGREYVINVDRLPYVLKWLTCFPAWAGVWIFVFLSGYGIGCCFFSGKYSLFNEGKISAKHFMKFYIRRFIRLAPIYYLYCILFEIYNGQFYFWNNRSCFIKMLTFTFNGNGGISGLGHLWYVSLAMQLYLFMPFIYLILRILRESKYTLLGLFIGVASMGLWLRFWMANKGYDWYTYSYTNCFLNMDLVILGMIIAEVKVHYEISIGKKSLVKCLTSVLFLSLVLYNCYIYQEGSINYLSIYRNVLPSAYAIICGLIILLAEKRNLSVISLIFERAVCGFSKYSYGFYIFHIVVFNYLSLTMVQSNFFSNLSVIGQYTIFFLVSFIITLILAIPLTFIEKSISLKYKKLEEKVFK